MCKPESFIEKRKRIHEERKARSEANAKTNSPSDSTKKNKEKEITPEVSEKDIKSSKSNSEPAPETDVIVKQERFVVLFKRNKHTKWRVFPRLFHDSKAAEIALKIAEKFIDLKIVEIDIPE